MYVEFQMSQDLSFYREIYSLFLPVLRPLLIGVVIYSCVFTMSIAFAENWTFLESLYFALITLTTVGYGDYVPHSQIGQIITSVFVLTNSLVTMCITILIVHSGSEHIARTGQPANPVL